MNYGRYQVLKEIGNGSMGVVYLTNDPQIDRLVAVKVLRKDKMEDDEFVKRFLKEAQAVGRLSHSNIVSIYDVGDEKGEIYIAMEFIEGVCLSEALLEKRFTVKEVIELTIQIADTLDYAHSKGVIHRDIKPSNIILQSDGAIKITDFGIARIEGASASLQTQAGVIMGTPAYMSPEQVLGQTVDRRSDLFSLGIILYELSTGRRPFGGDGKNMMTVFNEIIQFTPQDPCVAVNTIPPEFSKIIMKALQKNPDKRFQNGKELADALRGYLNEFQTVAEKAQPAERKRTSLAIPLVIILAIAALAAGAYFLMSGGKKTPGGSGSYEKPAVEAKPVVQQSPTPEPTASPVAATAAPATPAPVTATPAPAPAQPTPVSQPRAEKGSPAKPVKSPRPTPKPITGEGGLLSDPLSPPLRESSATLRVTSSPRGAQVVINGIHRGVTPLNLKLPHGMYMVRIEKPGFREVENLMLLNKNKEFQMNETLIADGDH